jgi:AcrR family transcriptional regulator
VYKECKTEKSAKRQKEIERSFLRLLTKKSFDLISITEMSKDLSIPRRAFYRYFESKESLLCAAIDGVLFEYESYNSSEDGMSRRTVTRELKKFFDFWLLPTQNQMLLALKRNNLEGYLIQRSIEYSQSQIAALSKFLPFDDAWQKAQIFNFTITGLMSMMLRWYNDGCRENTLDMAISAKRMITYPLFPNLENWGIFDE